MSRSPALPGMMEKPLPPIPVAHRCDQPGCTAWYNYGFTIAGHTHRFCPAHRDVGQRLMEASR